MKMDSHLFVAQPSFIDVQLDACQSSIASKAHYPFPALELENTPEQSQVVALIVLNSSDVDVRGPRK